MATEMQPQSTDLYEADFYVWALGQARLLRAREYGSLDLHNLIEEIEGLADAKKSAVLNSLRVVIERLLKLQHSPATDPRNLWRASVREHRRRVQTDLTPRIEQILVRELPRCYAMARDDAATGMHDHAEEPAAAALPAVCPTASTRSPATGGRERDPCGGRRDFIICWIWRCLTSASTDDRPRIGSRTLSR